MTNIKIRHSISNRIRFAVPLVKNNERRAATLKESLEDVDGVLWARINTLCGSLVVRFDKGSLTYNDVVALCRHSLFSGVPHGF